MNKNFLTGFMKVAYLDKRTYKTVDIGTLDPSLNDEVWTAKIDGAHTVIDLKKGKLPRLFSHRISKRTGNPIEYTPKLQHITNKSPVNAVVRGETYVVDDKGKILDPNLMTTILNSGTAKSIDTQKAQALFTRTALIDVDKFNGKDVSTLPFEQKRKLLEQIAKKDKNFTLPAIAKTPTQKNKLFNAVVQHKHPQTKEGLIVHKIHQPDTPFAKAKIINDHDVYVTGIYTEESKTGRKPMAGGFEYAWEPGGKPVGRIGTGFSHQMKEDMLKNPDSYVGKAARVKALDISKNKILMKPSFVDWHVEKNIKEPPMRAKQTIVVSKDIAKTREEAQQIAKQYADRIYTSRETSTSYRFRQGPPGKFNPDTFRTTHPKKGVAIVYGDLKE